MNFTFTGLENASIEEYQRITYRFDMNPSYEISDVEFMSGYIGYITNTSSTNSCHYLINKLENNFSKFSKNEKYIDFMKRLNEVKSDKRQSGIWQ